MNVSVAMATYNGGRYLREQLDSILRQSAPPHEIIICDDGSSDDTVEVARRFAAEAPFKVTVDAHGQRLGYNGNFYRAVSQCTGEIVALCDQDDVWMEHKLSAAVQPFADASVTTVTHRIRLVDDQLTPTGFVLPEKSLLGRYTFSQLDPWYAPKGMQLLFRRASVIPWLRATVPVSIYSHDTAPFDEHIFFAGTLAGTAVVLDDVLGVWRRHATAATIDIAGMARENDATHKLQLALHSGGGAYAYRAALTDARAEFAAHPVASFDGSPLTALPGAVNFYRRMSRMFRRRVRLHDQKTSRLGRLLLFVQMALRNDYRSKGRGGLGAKAALKDSFTIFFGPRPPLGAAMRSPNLK